MYSLTPALIARFMVGCGLWLIGLYHIAQTSHLVERVPQATGKAVHDDST